MICERCVVDILIKMSFVFPASTCRTCFQGNVAIRSWMENCISSSNSNYIKHCIFDSSAMEAYDGSSQTTWEIENSFHISFHHANSSLVDSGMHWLGCFQVLCCHDNVHNLVYCRYILLIETIKEIKGINCSDIEFFWNNG